MSNYERAEDAVKGWWRGTAWPAIQDFFTAYWGEIGERWAHHLVTFVIAAMLTRVAIFLL